jgi:hypothetical protein
MSRAPPPQGNTNVLLLRVHSWLQAARAQADRCSSLLQLDLASGTSRHERPTPRRTRPRHAGAGRNMRCGCMLCVGLCRLQGTRRAQTGQRRAGPDSSPSASSSDLVPSLRSRAGIWARRRTSSCRSCFIFASRLVARSAALALRVSLPFGLRETAFFLAFSVGAIACRLAVPSRQRTVNAVSASAPSPQMHRCAC